ncbi:MAG: hypothetical protein IJW93_02940 [Clostridia bacterium]|nr:hypothetical protein [Clostridia bacterium]
MKSTKILALLLVVVMCFSMLASCFAPKCEHVDANDDGKCDKCSENYEDGEDVEKPGPGTDPVGGYKDDGKTYSYRMAPADLPDAWNLHTYQSNSSTYVLDYSSDALYTFDYNDDYSGFVIVPSMAKDYPVDVTSEYVGKYGIVAGDENKAYKIVLRDDLKFDNGAVLNAESFVASMKLLLNPKAANFRADNVYKSGQIKIHNAEEYVKQNSYGLSEFVSANYGDDEYVQPADFTKTADGILQAKGLDIVIDLYSGGNWGSNGLVGYFSQNVFNSEDNSAEGFEVGAYVGLVYLATGEQMGWRSVSKNADTNSYDFYDMNWNKIEVGLNADKTMYIYNDKEVDFMTEVVDPDVLALMAAADDNGWVKLTDATLLNVQNAIAKLQGCKDIAEYASKRGDYAYVEFEEMAFLGKQYGELAYDGNVGFFKDADENAIVIVLKNPMEDNFYLRYELCTSFFLVYAPLYESLITYDNGVYNNTYGTSIDTYVGFGPYKLTQYVEGASIVLERNLNWYGYGADVYKEGTYQTDRVVYTKVTEEATRLQMFLKGEIDSYGLQPEDMEDYLASDYTYFNDTESTWYLAMNPDFETLKNNQALATPATEGNTVIKTVLSIDKFRQALSYSLDRSEFNLLLSPTSGIAKGLLSSMIVADPESGLTYRAMDEAKDAILEFWGLADQWGEGKEYADRDAAIASITGYDPEGAKALFTEAYNTAVAEGMISQDLITSGKWEVQIVIGKPADAAYYTNGYEFLKACWTKAVEGTPFEGHLSFVLSQTLGSTTFGEYLRTGSVDILFGVGYGGSMFDPYSMMDCFTGSLQYDPFTNKSSVMVNIEIDGKVLNASLYDWVSKCLQGDEITAKVVDAEGNVTEETVQISAGSSDPASRRVKILAACETKIMTLSNIFPVQTDASASLRCMRVNYKTEEYVVGMGRGGIQYYTYDMDDAEFLAYAAAQDGGILNYK